MKKWLIFFSSFALLILISFSSYLYLYRAEFTSTALSRMYGTPVKVNRIRVTSSDIELHNVTVYNPSEYSLQPALSISKVSVKMTPSDVIEALIGLTAVDIRKISIKDPLIGIEVTNAKDFQSNWKTILTSLSKASSQSGRTYYIKEISLNDIAIEYKNRAVRKHTARPPAINRLTFYQDLDGEPQTLSQILFWSTKMTLEDIGGHMHEPNFTASITTITTPTSETSPLTLKKREKTTCDFYPIPSKLYPIIPD